MKEQKTITISGDKKTIDAIIQEQKFRIKRKLVSIEVNESEEVEEKLDLPKKRGRKFKSE